MKEVACEDIRLLIKSTTGFQMGTIRVALYLLVVSARSLSVALS